MGIYKTTNSLCALNACFQRVRKAMVSSASINESQWDPLDQERRIQAGGILLYQ